MLGNFILKLVFFLTRGSYSLTLLSCNSDAQANDNVNSDVKVSTLDPMVFHGPYRQFLTICDNFVYFSVA